MSTFTLADDNRPYRNEPSILWLIYAAAAVFAVQAHANHDRPDAWPPLARHLMDYAGIAALRPALFRKP